MTPMEPHSTWSRTDRLAFVALCVCCLVGLATLVHPWHTFTNDGSIYLSTTRAILAGEGYAYLGMPFHLRPIGFPLLLAPVMAVAGANPAVLNYYVALFGAGSLLLLFVLARPCLGAALSLLVCLVVGLNPVFAALSSQVMSDVPGLFFVLLALVVARRCERNPTLANEVLLGVAIGWAAHVRVLGILLLPAVLLDRAWRARAGAWQRAFLARRCLPLIAVTTIVFAPWVVRNQLTAPEPPTDQFLNYSYATAMFRYDFGNPDSPLVSLGDWARRLRERGNQITAGLATRLQSSHVRPAHVLVTSLILGLYLYGLVRTPSAAGFFVALGLAITGSYFAYDRRLLLPLYALLVALLAAASRRGLARAFGERPAVGIVGVMLVALAVLDFSPRAGWTQIEARNDRMTAAARELDAVLPADATLASVRGFHLQMLLDRPVYSLRWATRRAQGVAGIEAVVARYGIDTVVLDLASELDRSFESYFVTRYGPGRVVAGFRVIALTVQKPLLQNGL